MKSAESQPGGKQLLVAYAYSDMMEWHPGGAVQTVVRGTTIMSLPKTFVVVVVTAIIDLEETRAASRNNLQVDAVGIAVM